MRYLETLSRVLAVGLAFSGGYLINGLSEGVGTKLVLVTTIVLYSLAWAFPLFVQRRALLELNERGYKVNLVGGWARDEWSLSVDGFSTTCYTISAALAAARDNDYRHEIIDEYKRQHGS